MKHAIALLALGPVACAGLTSSAEPDGDPGGGGPISTEQCTFAPRAGSATGMGRPTVNDTLEPFSYPEAFCQSLRRRDGTFSFMRFAFGTYAPLHPEAVFQLEIESMIGASATLTNAPVSAHLILPSGKRNWNGGRVTFDPESHHGSFSDDYDLMHFTFDCDPRDDIADAPAPAAPDHAAPGTAIVTRAPTDYVVVLDGVSCFDSATTPLAIERIDHGPDCSFSQLSLDATTSEPTLGLGTYPGEYSSFSTIDTVGEMRIADSTTSPGTLDISTGPPWTGFATFPTGANGRPDRVEFACAM